MHKSKKILVAPLSWGIGHATRCIPVINKIMELGYTPIIASDSDALRLLQNEFPTIKSYNLPAYNIKYAKKSIFFKLKLLLQFFKLQKVIKQEYAEIQKIIQFENVDLLISDNRFGVRNTKIPSVYITHQVTVLSGFTTYFTTKIHQKIIKKFDALWIPDFPNNYLSGILSTSKQPILPTTFIGNTSQFTCPKPVKLKHDLLIVLSGLEPQRTKLENKLLQEIKNYNGTIIFVRGVLSKTEVFTNTTNTIFYNFLPKKQLERVILESKIVLSRSGYSTIMDLAILQKKCFFIPTPKQSEQEYLAKHLKKTGIAPFNTQQKFKISDLKQIENYSGFTTIIKKENLLENALLEKLNQF